MLHSVFVKIILWISRVICQTLHRKPVWLELQRQAHAKLRADVYSPLSAAEAQGISSRASWASQAFASCQRSQVITLPGSIERAVWCQHRTLHMRLSKCISIA